MASDPSMSDLDLRQSLSDFGYNAGPVTDSTRFVYKRKLSEFQESSSTDSLKKSQGQKRKAKTSPSSATRTPTKLLRLASEVGLPQTRKSQNSPSPESPKAPPAGKVAAKRGRPTRSAAKCTPDVEPVLTPNLASLDPVQQNIDSVCSLSPDYMKDVFLAAVRVLEKNGAGGQLPAENPQPCMSGTAHPLPVPSYSESSRSITGGINALKSQSRLAKPCIVSSTKEERMARLMQVGLPHSQVHFQKTRENTVEKDSLHELYPEAHKFVEEAWYSTDRERRIKELLNKQASPDLPRWRIPDIDPELVAGMNEGVNIDALCSAQDALENAAGPIYTLIHQCVGSNGVLTKKLVKDCIRDSLAFVSCAHEILGSEGRRIRDWQQEMLGSNAQHDFEDMNGITSESMFQQQVASAVGGIQKSPVNHRISRRVKRY